MARIGVVLSGCGYLDGAEIYESTLTLFFLDQAGADVTIMAPDIDQHHVINHITQEEMPEHRNVLVEAARIARGNISNLAEIDPDNLDALIMPGGFGAAKNLSTLAFDGANASVNPDLINMVRAMHKAKKPIGAICISPAVLSKILSKEGVTLTIGSDSDTASVIQTMGNKHEISSADNIVIDEKNRIVSTAAYMCAASIGEAGLGIEKLVSHIMGMIDKT
ncbi:MAG: isoprenoid biosynthesis glyoxalase ElbB [Magnetococcales bacterium]|nr:isoprenoid biosynthesis glyoxalase ElbB [Magnetococcales bacterium]